jgi:hypothetical protein
VVDGAICSAISLEAIETLCTIDHTAGKKDEAAFFQITGDGL